MVSSRHRSSTASTASSSKPPLEEWTTREKLILASLAIKCNNSWASVARQMHNLAEEARPDGYFNQKTCAAQFDKLMNELGVDKRPKRNEPSDGNSSTVIYRKMVEKRAKELEENIVELRKSWLKLSIDIESSAKGSVTSEQASDKSDQTKPRSKSSLQTPTRALTRRESSRKNLEKTLSVLCKEAAEMKPINLLTKPATEPEREIYDKAILKHVDLSTIEKRFNGEVEDAFAVMNDLLLMLQNAIMFYPPEHQSYKAATILRERLVPKWEDRLRLAN